ncbi:MAG: DUF3379 family protein [Steroidobacteraceae bacterium]
MIEHLRGEPQALVRTSDEVAPTELASVLSRSRVTLKPGVAHVSYAMSCWFRGHFVPHLVVQTERGPVTVLVMPQEPAPERATRVDEGGFHGVIVPAPQGVLVVLGHDASVETVAAIVVSALEYTH